MKELTGRINLDGTEYEIIELLGKGKGSYTYLITDDTGTKYVLKKIHHESGSFYNFGSNLQSDISSYESLLNVPECKMPKIIKANLQEEYIIKEFIDGKTIAELIVEENMKEEYLQQMIDMCQVLYKKGLTIDYFPTNYVVINSKNSGVLDQYIIPVFSKELFFENVKQL